MKICTLFFKNIRCFTRLELIAYMLLPMALIHLVWIRSFPNKENMANCYELKSISVGKLLNLNLLYNAVSEVDLNGPHKSILLQSNHKDVTDLFPQAMGYLLGIKKIVTINVDESIEKLLEGSHYFAGIIWNKRSEKNQEVSIMFPSALRTHPISLWPTNEIDVKGENYTSIYRKEGFLQILYALILLISAIKDYKGETNLDPSIFLGNQSLKIYSQPFLWDSSYFNEIKQYSSEPIKEEKKDIFPFLFSFLYIFPLIRMALHMSREREREIKELIRISTGSTCMQYTAFFFSTFFVMVLILLGITIILKTPLSKNGNILNCSSFTALLVFFLIWSIAAICFTFLLYAIIHNTYALILVLTTVFIASYIVVAYYKEPTTLLSQLLFYSVFHIAFLDGIKWILKQEDEFYGLQWNHYQHFNTENGLLLFGAIPIMMAISCVVCLFLCVLFEICCPGKYGISMIDRNNTKTKVRSTSERNTVENSSVNSSAVVQVNMLSKAMRRKAVKDFHMNMYDDQITVILGLSDSGKSIIMNALAGSQSAKSGWIIIDGRDIVRSTLSARKSLGFCPQHDALFDELSVNQHFAFYSNLRGSKKSTWQRDLKRYLRAMQMENIRFVKARNLSSIDKRKLSVICAFCDNPRLIILDEPSERMDTISRRLLWCLLNCEKMYRTIVLSTYQMEEADFLGDRIGILFDGELLFNGTSFFLKNNFGSGYKLVCSQGELAQEPQISSVVMRHIPETYPSIDIPTEITYNISHAHYTRVLPLLTDLETRLRARQLSAESIGIGTTSVLDKFVNATTQDSKCVAHHCWCCDPPRPEGKLLYGMPLHCNQWHAMYLKKCYHVGYNKCLFLSLLLFCIIAFLSLQNVFKIYNVPLAYVEEEEKMASQVSLKLHPSIYGNNCKVGFIRDSTEKNDQITFLRKYIEKSSKCETQDISSESLDVMRQSLNNEYIFAIQIKACKYRIYYSTKFLHTEAVAAAMLGTLVNFKSFSASCQQNLDEKINWKLVDQEISTISFIHHPYKAYQFSGNSTYKEIVCFESGDLYLMLFCITLLSSFFAVYVLYERVIGYKLLQFVEGLNVWIYWLSHVLLDGIFLAMISCLLVFLMTFIHKMKNFIELSGFLAVLIVYGFALLPFLYLLMGFFRRPIAGWILPSLILTTLIIPFEFGLSEIPYGILYLLPPYAAIAGLHSVCIHASSKTLCSGPETYIGCNIHPYLSSTWSGLPYISILSLLGIVYFLLLICFERRPFCSGGSKSVDESPKVRSCCVDFNICNRFLTGNEIRNHILIMKSVTSKRTKRGITNLSLAIKRMYVVGLVGRSSGKTSLIETIVCARTISKGYVYIKGIDVHKSCSFNRFAAYRYTGYCPQIDSFDPDFTGRQNIKIFCLIRGIPRGKIKGITDELGENLSFKEHLNKQSWKYTVSDKRKLSTAIAVIGTPPLIILDEPTAGIEMAHRPDVLELLKSVHENGSAILLASRHIEDFEALCTHLAFIDQGKLISCGCIDDYKRNDCQGLSLYLKIRPFLMMKARSRNPNCSGVSNVQKITDFLLYNFHNVMLLERNHDDALYYIYNPEISFTQAFHIIEHNRSMLNITDFFLRQESLELSFAGHRFPILQ